MDQVRQEDNHQVVMLFDVGRGEGGGGGGDTCHRWVPGWEGVI